MKTALWLGVVTLLCVGLAALAALNDGSGSRWQPRDAVSLLVIIGGYAVVLAVLFLRGRRGIVICEGSAGPLPWLPWAPARLTPIEQFVGLSADEYLARQGGAAAAITMWRPARGRVWPLSRWTARRWVDDEDVPVLKCWQGEHGPLEPIRFLPEWLDESAQDQLMLAIDRAQVPIHVRRPVGLRRWESPQGTVHAYPEHTTVGRWRDVPVMTFLVVINLGIGALAGAGVVAGESSSDRGLVAAVFGAIVALLLGTRWWSSRSRLAICGTRVGLVSPMTGRVREWSDLREAQFLTLRVIRVKGDATTHVVAWRDRQGPRPQRPGWKSALSGASQATRTALANWRERGPLHPRLVPYSGLCAAGRRDLDRALQEAERPLYR